MVDDQCGNIAQFKEKAAASGKAFGYLEAKITEVSERDVNKKDGTTSHVHELTLEDSTGSIKITLWDSDMTWKAGEVFSGTALYTGEYKGEINLSASRKSRISKKLASSKAATTAQKPAAAKTAGTVATGGSSLNVSALEKKIDNMKGEILNAIKESQIAIIDQMKEVIKLATGPTEGGEGAGEAGSEEATTDEVHEEPPEGA